MPFVAPVPDTWKALAIAVFAIGAPMLEDRPQKTFMLSQSLAVLPSPPAFHLKFNATAF